MYLYKFSIFKVLYIIIRDRNIPQFYFVIRAFRLLNRNKYDLYVLLHDIGIGTITFSRKLLAHGNHSLVLPIRTFLEIRNEKNIIKTDRHFIVHFLGQESKFHQILTNF